MTEKYNYYDGCEPPARVFVGDRRAHLPYINDGVVTRITRDGPTDLTRYSQVHWPAEWQGTDYISLFENGIDPIDVPDELPFDEAIETAINGLANVGEVQLYDESADTYIPVHRGPITAVGPASGSPNEMRLIIQDPSEYLGLRAGKAFNGGSGLIERMLQFVAEEIEAKNPIFDSVPLRILDVENTDSLDPQEKFWSLTNWREQPFAGDFNSVNNPKAFTSNRDTLGDVIEWITDKTDLKVWFEPYTADDGEHTVALVAARDPYRRFAADGVEIARNSRRQRVNLLRNNALYQINPVNAVYARGAAADTAIEVGGFDLRTGDRDGTYPFALVQHDPTVARAGRRLTKAVNVSGNDRSSVITQARNELKRLIEGSGRGEMVSLPDPHVRPYSLLSAKPTCGDSVTETNPIRYEISGVVHHIKADYGTGEDVGQPHTQIKVRPDTRPSSFTVVRDGTKQTKDTDGDGTGVPDFVGGLPLLP